MIHPNQLPKLADHDSANMSQTQRVEQQGLATPPELQLPDEPYVVNHTMWMIGLVCSILIGGVWVGSFVNTKLLSEGIMIYHAIACLFFILVISILRKKPIERTESLFIWLTMCMFNCLIFNEEIRVFSPFAHWTAFIMGVLAVCTVIYPWRAKLPRWASNLFYFSMSLSAVLCGYLTLFMFPTMIIGVPALLLLGLSIYAFIPLLFTISLIRKLRREWSTHRRAILAGLVAPAVVVVLFLMQWNLTEAAGRRAMRSDNDMPDWIKLSKVMSPTWVAHRWLGEDLFYQKASDEPIQFDFEMQRSNVQVFHDPLVILGRLSSQLIFGSTMEVSAPDRIKALHTLFGDDHSSEERLWRGDNLHTSHMNTAVQLYPTFRTAETTQEWEIYNDAEVGANQEAIYTFHLPEGGVVTNLSLWVNDVEQPGHLTTKSRATHAYKEVVGVERRDPSIVHWKEGNRVSVRVFPCNNLEKRKVKITYVSPLRIEGDRLVYDNALFDGPLPYANFEDVYIKGIALKDMNSRPFGLTERNGAISGNAGMKRKWQLSMAIPPVQTQTVSWNNKTYQQVPLENRKTPFKPDGIYLDLNRSWSRPQFSAILEAAKKTPCFVWNTDKWIQLNAKNYYSVLKSNQSLLFSLFPFHKLPAGKNNLIISKSTDIGPMLTDIQTAAFGSEATAYFADAPPVKVFSLGALQSPYLRTLRTFGALQVHEGNLENVVDNLSKGVFEEPNIHDDEIAIAPIKLKLVPDLTSIKAGFMPVPASKLWAYQDIMQQISSDYFRSPSESTEEKWLDAARLSGVVTPITSLIVLETEEDYQRFNIDGKGDKHFSANTQHDADGNIIGTLAKGGGGSVPEPREWALILFGLTVMVWFCRKSSLVL